MLPKKAIVATNALDCEYLVIHPLMHDYDHDDNPAKTFQENVRLFKELCEFAKPYGVTICIENMPFRNLEISSVEGLMKIVDEVNCENFGICLDTGHSNVLSHDLGDDVRYCGSKLKCLHIHDNRFDDEHLWPYMGWANWDSFRQGIKDIGYNGVFSLECSANTKLPPDLLEYMRIGLIKITELIATTA